MTTIRHPIRVHVQLPHCCEVVQDFHLVWCGDEPNVVALECGILPDTGERHIWWLRLPLLDRGRYRAMVDPANGDSCEPSPRHPNSWMTLVDHRLGLAVFLPTSSVGLFLLLVDERLTRTFRDELADFDEAALDVLADQLLNS